MAVVEKGENSEVRRPTLARVTCRAQNRGSQFTEAMMAFTHNERQSHYRARQRAELARLRAFEKAVLRERERGSAVKIKKSKKGDACEDRTTPP
jgi:hypothetical protein